MDGELSVHFDTLVVEIVTLLREDKHNTVYEPRKLVMNYEVSK